MEEISAPRCVEIERALIEALDIPVFHDDQHGTAVVVTAALINALKLVKKEAKDLKVVISGTGAAGSAIIHMLIDLGVKNILAFSKDGALNEQMANATFVEKRDTRIDRAKRFFWYDGGSFCRADVFNRCFCA